MPDLFKDFIDLERRELAEDVILGLADIIHENRKLKKDNHYLKEELDKHERRLDNDYKNMQCNIARTLNNLVDNIKEE